MSQILVAEVSTRRYAWLLNGEERMRRASGNRRSRASSRRRARPRARALMERSFAKIEVLAVYIDGIQIGGYHVLATVGLDDTGKKHLLGLARGASKNTRVVKDLLDSLVKRGIDASRQRLFVIDGGKALRSGIEEVYGERSAGAALPHPQTAQRDRALARSAAHVQARSVMHAAYKLPEKDGMARAQVSRQSG